MDVLKSLVQPLVGGGSNNSAIDGFKLVVLGGAVETARRASSSACDDVVFVAQGLCPPIQASFAVSRITAIRYFELLQNHFVNSFFLTAHFSEDDFPYDWLMLWLSRRPEWQRSREVETTTRTGGPGGSSSSRGGGSSGSSSPWGTPTGNNASSGSGGGAHPSSHSAHYNEEDRDWDMWEAALYAETNSASAASHWGESGNDNSEDGVRPRTRVVFQPTYDTTHTIFYRGHWLRVRRGRKDNGSEMLSISVVARNNAILKQLVLQAKKEYEAEAIHRIQIYFADAHGSWRWTDSRHKRPLSSIVLNPGVKEMLADDARDFLRSEKWYADRGIPFRRGYLLHGVPGSGKSSLIHALAGQLQLDIYVVSLSASWISDNTLTSLMGRVPARCVLLLEDLDAAFVRSTNREDDGENGDGGDGGRGGGGGGGGYGNGGSGGYGGNSGGFGNNGGLGMDAFPSFSGLGGRPRRRFGRADGLSDMNTLSLSGLLNALDGVAASEGRLLFATTNHLERLDPALSRPGRMDVWVEFKNASRWQAEALFRNFFPCEDVDDEAAAAELKRLNLNIDDKVQAREFRPNVEAVEKAMSEASSGSLESATGSESVLMSRSASVSVSVSGASTPRTPRTPLPSETLLMPDQAPAAPPSTLWSLSTGIASSATSLFSLSGSVLGSTPSVSSLGVSTASSPTAVSSASVSSRTPSRLSSAVNQPQPQAQQPRTGAAAPALDAKDQFGSDNTAYLPPPPDASLAKPKPLDKKTLAVLAKQFADGVPEEEFSVASLQGSSMGDGGDLLKHKAQPEAAASGVEAWVKSELEMRERLQREKEAREEKEKEHREKRRKENAEKQKAQRETEKKEKELERVKALLAEKDKEDELEKMRQQLKEKEEAAKKKKEKREKKEKEKSEGKKSKKEKEKDEKKSKKAKKDKKVEEPKSDDENEDEKEAKTTSDKKEKNKETVDADKDKTEESTTSSNTDTDAETKATDPPTVTPIVVASDSSSSDSSSSSSSDSDSSDSDSENRAPPAPAPTTSPRKKLARRRNPSALSSNSAAPAASTSWSSAPRPASSSTMNTNMTPYMNMAAPIPIVSSSWASWPVNSGNGGTWSPTSPSPPPGW
ncbi:hypothetical protein D9619_011488 [Psilocybe cf. subviscida]|uniref:AAA+ ATPase domain-containing protein n=1 Tax=Psilocybe cf. subviscida TaxID=2480587 RepID=A0A8H5BSD0_9AGAR|nr:hypothetical protein D9619_011488 [Psilocybe cf. subviscida]